MLYIITIGICLLVFGLIGFAIYLIYLEHCGKTLYQLLEDELQCAHMTRAEKKSRARVSEIIHSNMSAMEKCLALDKEMAVLSSKPMVSKQWKRIVHSLFTDILKKNGLTLKSNHVGGTYIKEIYGEEFSKCLTMF